MLFCYIYLAKVRYLKHFVILFYKKFIILHFVWLNIFLYFRHFALNIFANLFVSSPHFIRHKIFQTNEASLFFLQALQSGMCNKSAKLWPIKWNFHGHENHQNFPFLWLMKRKGRLFAHTVLDANIAAI